jgi:hypothetical protein
VRLFFHPPYSCGTSPRASTRCRYPSGGHPVFFVLLSSEHLLRDDGSGEQNHAFLDGLAMALGELQMGNPSEALVASVGSKHGVRWGPSSYS